MSSGVDAFVNEDLERVESDPKPKKTKGHSKRASPAMSTEARIEAVLAFCKTTHFLVGVFVGIILGAGLVFTAMSMQLDRAKLDVLRVQLQHKRENAPSEKLVELCDTKVRSVGNDHGMKAAELMREIADLKESNIQANFTIKEYAARCLLCANTSQAVAKAIGDEQYKCTTDTENMKLDLDTLRADKAVWEREKLELTMEVQDHVNKSLGYERTKMEIALKNFKRELEVSHHVEISDHKSAREQAERLVSDHQRDRDQALADNKALESEKDKCTNEMQNIKGGQGAEMEKIMGELEALSAASSACQKTTTDHENTLCQLCDHCQSVHFPVCKQCRHGKMPVPGHQEPPKGQRGRFYF